MELSGVEAIQARISEIQRRFGIEGPVPGTTVGFQRALDAELKKNDGATPPQTAGGGATSKADTAKMTPAEASTQLSSTSNETTRFIREAAAKYGLDSRLVAAVAEAESSGNQSEVSEAGAVGVMQLMPDTAAALGVNPYDEKQNIEGGAHYLKQMLDTFGGDMKKAIAAYNAGPQAVKDYGGVPPYAETQNYVNKVLDLYR
ncbi:lytic transglycosylase domain-containing protein [uncultured Selenomonas sp.]|uniref:lytic transglycosylase domain-containing protein n=1 Tax=uncultured Selenomonas sp. TaxID=159275 RepID=UPI0028EC22AF|nr:lytic transglycosylase domain-containing protein [uncultured Selenomonas sp.]